MLILANFAFVGSHFLMSHPMRAKMIWLFKPGGFTLIYSGVSLVLFYWVVVEFARAPKLAPYWIAGDVHWVAASVVTLVAAVLFVGSLIRNPSLPGANENLAAQKPFGVYKVTRHPMMWSFALWGVAHILIAPRIDNLIFYGSLIFLALAGAKAQERKKAKLIGVGWDAWLRQTSFSPRLTNLGRIGAASWITGIAFWAVATWAHNFFGAIGAGIFRWINA